MNDTQSVESLAQQLWAHWLVHREDMILCAMPVLRALAAERDELRAALEPFVAHNSSEPTVTITVKTEDVTRARTVLAGGGS